MGVLTEDQRPVRVILAALKYAGELPVRKFRRYMTLDCNERVVEYAFVIERLGNPKGKRILDFGCTESMLPISLASLGGTVVGADLRDYEYEHPNFSFFKGDFVNNKFENSSFDRISRQRSKWR